ncbi:MAG: hypothetical protein DMF82_22245 [Acidobacteria bacterium]|nr:MAG: hypothetical protein DMF82_22245 [Acidobacteriota bacterium]
MSARALVALRVVFVLALLPLATGIFIVTYQDASMTHLPGKWATVEMARAGTFPFLQPYASFGQPLAGNPNFGTFFPDTLLFLFLPLTVAFGAHFAIAAALAFIGARRWARAEGVDAAAAHVAALAFVLSGVFVSTWKFYNSGMALAVAPWVLSAASRLARGGAPKRTSAELGLCGALEVLAGEPVIALLTFLLAAGRVVAGGRRGPMRSRLAGLAGGLLLAALIAAPQILLTWQIFHGSSRELRPFPFVTATGTSVHPMLALEQVLPFPFGRPDLTGAPGFSGHAWFDNHSPYLWTLHVGWATLALLLLFGRARTGPERGFYVVALVAAVLSLGKYLPYAKKIYPLLSLDGRIRFPVKWWYVVALCLVPAVGWAAQRWQSGERPNRFSLEAVGAMLVGFLGVVIVHGAGTPLAWLGALASAAAVSTLVMRRRAPSTGAVAMAILVFAAAADGRPDLRAHPRRRRPSVGSLRPARSDHARGVSPRGTGAVGGERRAIRRRLRVRPRPRRQLFGRRPRGAEAGRRSDLGAAGGGVEARRRALRRDRRPARRAVPGGRGPERAAPGPALRDRRPGTGRAAGRRPHHLS